MFCLTSRLSRLPIGHWCLGCSPGAHSCLPDVEWALLPQQHRRVRTQEEAAEAAGPVGGDARRPDHYTNLVRCSTYSRYLSRVDRLYWARAGVGHRLRSISEPRPCSPEGGQECYTKVSMARGTQPPPSSEQQQPSPSSTWRRIQQHVSARAVPR